MPEPAQPTRPLPPAHAMWGGRFSEPMDPRLDRLNRSLPTDRALWREDLATNRAWVAALAGVGVVSAAEGETMLEGLSRVEARLAAGAADGAPDEDIHTLVERLLLEEIGEPAGKLHTGRSRNDQVATDLRLWTMRSLDALDAALLALARALLRQADEGLDVLLPGYTHTQRAQPIRWAHWAASHCWPLLRDRERIAQARERAAVLPLGAGAIAGSGFPVDRRALAASLGMRDVAPNSVDAVGDRDFAVEAVFVAALVGVHLSRLAADLMLYSTAEFGFVRLAEPFTTGSSLMPQKRNPDALELVRAKAGALAGGVGQVLGVLRALPSGYQKDFQESNAVLFASLEGARDSADLMAGVVDSLCTVPERMAAALDPSTLATELADLLVKRGRAFREAHQIVGQLVRRAEERGCDLTGVAGEEVAEIDPALPGLLAELGGALEAVERRTVEGGTARAAVLAQLGRLRALLAG